MSNTAPTVDFVVLSNIIIDDVVLANGETRFGILGGAATYAAAGIRLWSSSVGLVAGMGEDFDGGTRGWFDSNGFNLEGVTTRHTHSPRSWVCYAPDGERVETPQHGIDHFHRMESSAGQIPAAYRAVRGLYIFRSHDPAFWASLAALPASPAQVILWEIAANAALPELRPMVTQALRSVQILSINRTEALRLFGVQRPLDALHAALEDGAQIVALRLGAEGSLVTDGRHLLQIPAAPARVVDVTGGGNAYSGGFLAGYGNALAEQRSDPLAAGARAAAAAAASAIEQYGPPRYFDEAALLLAQERAAGLNIVCSVFA